MKVPLNWLREYVSIPISPDELAKRLTIAGIAVDGIERTGGAWDRVFVGEIVALARHPNADRLQLATVNYGAESATVVTGAPNIAIGDRVPFALIGAELWDMHQDPPKLQILKSNKIRGIESAGMVCSSAELGLGSDHAGIMILGKDAPVGELLKDVIGDVVLSLELTPNRSDCLSMLGVAQEVSALIRSPLIDRAVSVEGDGSAATDRVSVEITEPELCTRYSAAIIEGVHIGESPPWMRERLIAAGVRPISNVVDITNYVMLEYGQPLHAFDLDQIVGKRIIVRRARPGEHLRTLDGVDRTLIADMLVIADAENAVGLAGVMGGDGTEVKPTTTTILLESATFNPTSIRRTSRGLKLPSEAARRFEKGLPVEMTIPALERAAGLMRDLTGGTVLNGWIDVQPRPSAPRTVDIPLSEFRRLLGVVFDPREISSILTALGFVTSVQNERVHVEVPYRRVDVSIPADVVEEVARVSGYDKLPTTILGGCVPDPPFTPTPWIIEERLRDILVGCGLSEVIMYSLISAARLEKVLVSENADSLAAEVDARFVPKVAPIRIVNPLSSEMAVLRTSTIPQAIETVRDNLRWMDRDVSIFEIGRIYLDRPDQLPEERRILTIATGGFRSGDALGSRVPFDFLDIKGHVEMSLDRIGIPSISFAPVTHQLFRGGHCAAVFGPPIKGNQRLLLGVLGEVAQKPRRAFGVDEPVFIALLDIARLMLARVDVSPIRPLARFPAVYQDLGVVLDESITSEDVRRAIMRAGKPLATGADLFDVYRGEALGPGKRSLAFRVTYQSRDRTLNDLDVAAAHDRIESAMRKDLGAAIRGRMM